MKRLLMCAVGLLAWTAVAAAQDICPPAKVTTLSVATGKTTAAVSWSSTGDDCTTGNATSYEIRVSTSPIAGDSWQGADLVATGSAGAGCRILSDLLCNTTYYFAILLIDDAGNYSPVSNVVQQATQGCGTTTELEECQ